VIRVGIVGCGHVARESYFPGLTALGKERVTIVAVFDTLRERVDDALEHVEHAKGYTTYGEFLEHDGGDGIDLVFNLTPAPLHRDITSRALEAGYHVYSEKPIASTVKEAEELSQTAARQGKMLFCAPSTMVTARFKWLKQALEAGEFGRPTVSRASIGHMGPATWREYIGDPRVFYKKGVGPLVDVGVYMLHTITGLLGPATRVQASGGIVIPERTILTDRYWGEKVQVETPDLLSINLDLEENRYAHLFASFATPGTKSPMFELYGTKGAFSIGPHQWYDGNGGTDLFKASSGREGERVGWQDNVPVPERNEPGDILGSGILHAVECLEQGTESMLTARHATHVLEIMNGALASIETGDAVELTTSF
jgi:predicted dehydrogenase